jgi:hypothetical protein
VVAGTIAIASSFIECEATNHLKMLAYAFEWLQ